MFFHNGSIYHLQFSKCEFFRIFFSDRSEIININTNEPVFYPYRIKMIKCKGSCNTDNDPYAERCVPDNIKNINI